MSRGASERPLLGRNVVSKAEESTRCALTFDAEIKRLLGSKSRVAIDLEQPRLELRVKHHIEAEDLEAMAWGLGAREGGHVRLHLLAKCGLGRDDRLDEQVVHIAPYTLRPLLAHLRHQPAAEGAE